MTNTEIIRKILIFLFKVFFLFVPWLLGAVFLSSDLYGRFF